MEAKKKHLQAFVGLIGEAMESLAKRHKKEGLSWPDPQFVRQLKEETARGMIPLVVTGGSELGHGGGYRTEGEHEDLIRGGVKVAEFIKEPSNLFNPDGTIREQMGAVLVHEYCHALQDAAMGNMSATKRSMIPIASIEHANQALAIEVWNEMNRIRNSSEPYYKSIRKRLEDAHGDAIEKLPPIDPETMRYQDRVSKYPGAIFMAQHPEYFKEGRIEADVKEEHLMGLARDVAKQVKAANEKVDIPRSIRATMANYLINNKVDGIDHFIGAYRKETGQLLSPFAPDDGEHVRNIVGFYAREIKHQREIEKLADMRDRANSLSPQELEALHDFAIKNEIAQDIRNIDPKTLINGSLAHKIGELEANREGIAQAEGILGARLRELHRMGRDPEAKLELFTDPLTRKKLDEIRARAKEREKGKFREEGKGILERMRRKLI